jgi:membrane protein DedA with SNARE-associated domain
LHDGVVSFVQSHRDWAPLVICLLSFGESLAFVSLVVPATVILVGIGGLIGASGVPFWPNWVAAALGAFLGDWLSFWLGRHYSLAIASMWPLSRRPALLRRGAAFFHRWGTPGIFLGRFFGPLRSIVPLTAGICGMRWLPFQIANIASALIWAAGVLLPGSLAAHLLL